MTKNRDKQFAFLTLDSKEPHHILMGLGHGYLEAAVALGQHVGDVPSGQHGGVFTYLPVLFNLHQGIENFLKGAALWLGQDVGITHDVEELVEVFNASVHRHESLTDRSCFGMNVVEPVAKWDRWAAERVPRYTCGMAMRFLTDKKRKPVYRGLSVSEDEIVTASVKGRAEAIRVHIALIQALTEKPATCLMNPLNCWWEPVDQYEKRKDAAIREIEDELGHRNTQ